MKAYFSWTWWLLSSSLDFFAATAVSDPKNLARQSCFLQCQALETALPEKLHYANDTAYNLSLSTYWSTQEQSLKPKCILTPASAQDVSTALQTLSAWGTCPFAVKSGGHMAQAGAANIQDGVTIDLSGLNQFSVDPSNNSATLGPGLRWGQVYTKLAAFGLAAPGGRSGDVGVGGYLLGGDPRFDHVAQAHADYTFTGGSSYFIGHGFGCDNVDAYQIVLANGTILNVTASAHRNLFRALKGGSSNFGIVTSFTIRTFKLGGIWGGNIYYPAEPTLDQQLKAFNKFAGNDDYDINAAVQMSISFSPSVGTIFVNQPFYALPQVNPPALQPFTNIQPQLGNETTLNTLASFAIADGNLSPDGSRQTTWALCIENDLQMLQALYDAFNSSTRSIAHVSGISWSVTLEPLPKVFLQASARQGGNVLGLPTNPGGNALILCDSSYTWTYDNDTAIVRSAGLSLLNDIVRRAETLGTSNPWIDVNHADVSQDPMSSFGSANKAFLQAVSREYDPTHVFQKHVPGGFKVFP